MDIYEAFNSAGLIWALEMTFKLRAKLLDLDVFCGAAGLVDVLRVDGPVSWGVVGALILRRLPASDGKSRGRAKLGVCLRQEILRLLCVTAQLAVVVMLSHFDSLIC